MEHASFRETNAGLLMQLCGATDFLVVAVEGVEVLGYALAMPTSEERARVVSLAVKPGYRRSGLGRALLRESLDRLREAGVLWVELEVRVSNEAARRLYRDLGFSKVGAKSDYYNDGEDAVLMEKRV